METLDLVGGKSAQFQRFLATADPCFGRLFKPDAAECKECVCPVVINDKVFLLREACATRTAANRAKGPEDQPSPPTTRMLRLSSQEVVDRFHAGKTWEDVFVEMLAGGDPELLGIAVRARLYEIWWQISKVYQLPVDKLPYLKALKTYAKQNRKGSRP